ncbi:MAG: 4Fe-4S dicluster domain-containing protein [Planctomycetota bacterium]|jgi:heterodisulfide reductase subunit C
MPDAPVIRPHSDFLSEVEARSGEKVTLCYHCRKCTNGCPMAFAMDVTPNQAMRMIQLGLEEELYRSRAIWICASCQTCTTRCPNDIDIAHLMDTLRQMSQEAGAPAGEKSVVKFHKAFLSSLRRHGRVFELGMVAGYKLGTLDLFSDTKVAWQMFKRGKLKLLPARIKGKREVRRMFAKEQKEQKG